MNTFDKDLRKKLYNAEMDVSEGMWASIESQIPVKKEKPKFWFFFLLSAAFIAFIYVYNQSDIKAPTIQNDTNIISIVDTDVDDLIFDYKTIAGNQQNPTINHIKNSTSVNSTNPHPSVETFNQLITTRHTNTIEDTPSPSLDVDLHERSSKKLKFVVNPFKSTLSNRNNNSLKLIEKSRINEIGQEVSHVVDISSVKDIPLVQKPNFASSVTEKLEDRFSVATCPKFEKYSSDIYFYTEAFLGKNFQQLSTLDLELRDFAAQRDRNEMSAVSLSATFGIGKEFRNGFLAETGINYDRIRMSFRLDRTQEIIEHIDCVNDQGVVFTKSDTTIVSNSSNLNNTFTQINIPLVVGYRHYINDRISVAGKIGTLLNLNSRNQGQFLDNNGNLVTYNSDNVSSSLFQTNLDLSYLASIQLQAQLGSQTNAYVGINSNFYPSNFGLIGNPIQQRYTKVGLSLGVNYHI